MSNGWTKYFLDGTRYLGHDHIPNRTWRNSRQQGILKVDCFQDGHSISIVGSGDYWQSDDLVSVMSLNVDRPSKVVSRRVLKKIEPGDKLVQIISSSTSMDTRFMPTDEIPVTNSTSEYLLVQGMIGAWFVVQMDINNGKYTFRYYFSKEKI